MKNIFKYALALLVVVYIVYLVGSIILPKLSVIGKESKHKVYVLLGFHANFYHSYRIDTNDEAGFGKDIRIVRKIIEVLDEKNKKGIPVKGVWDFENLFTLEEILPRYAPDIIQNIKHRVKEHGDEIILMSYNNGLVSAMTRDEFVYSLQNAITNVKKSGVKDIFGVYSPYVRPQEMMTSAGNFNLYKELGIQGVVLYYSAIPFDAFRVFVDELSLEEAHNPLIYNNTITNERMLVIPAYNHADLIENVSIYNWVQMLRHEQLRGNIKNDVLICINSDADDSYWYGYKLPSYLKWVPNTGGLSQLIDDIASLDYVEFTTLHDYVQHHKPVKEISFGQDTADGSFNGYVSWAEKKYCSDYWTAVEKDRMTHALVKALYKYIKQPIPENIKVALGESFQKRMRLLSTTNFGMATPFLAKNREHIVDELIQQMQSTTNPVVRDSKAYAQKICSQDKKVQNFNNYEYVNSLLVLTQNADNFVLTIAGDLHEGYDYFLKYNSTLLPVFVFSHNGISRIFVKEGILSDGVYHIVRKPHRQTQYTTNATKQLLKNSTIAITFKQGVNSVEAHGKDVLDEYSLLPWIQYNNKNYRPEKIDVTVLRNGDDGVAAVKISGTVALPQNITPGQFEYVIALVAGIDIIFVDGTITYPDTPRTKIFKPGMPQLARIYDPAWQQVAPCPLYPAMRATKKQPFTVLKRNYLGVESQYTIDYFKHSRKNLDLANVNNHITAEYVAITNGKECIAVAKDNATLSNFAFCPLQVTHNFFTGFAVSLNPFGTFFGLQYYQPTWGKGRGFKAAILNGDQYQSGACTYSGTTQHFALAIVHSHYPLPQKLQQLMISYANQPFVMLLHENQEKKTTPPLQPPKGVFALYKDGGVYVNFEKADGAASYIIHCGDTKDSLTAMYKTKDTSLFVKEYAKNRSFKQGNTYYVAVQAVSAQGKQSKLSAVYAFAAQEIKEDMDLPLTLQLKIMLDTIITKLRW
ncbi:MAG: hypothetical protein AB1444_06145 [Spirochaetota bacterium]